MEACHNLLQKFHQHGSLQHEWISVDTITRYDINYLKIAKTLPSVGHASSRAAEETEDDDLEDNDEEVLSAPKNSSVIICYDIILSPTYRVPVLYISILDPQHRYPPTMTTLYDHLILPQYRGQAEAVGVIGGITITDHPITNSPVFFIHPCQTANVMEASVGKKSVTAEQYLLMWIGAMGKSVGLNIPLALVKEGAK